MKWLDRMRETREQAAFLDNCVLISVAKECPDSLFLSTSLMDIKEEMHIWIGRP